MVGCIRDLGKCIYPGELWRWPSCTLLQAQSRAHILFFFVCITFTSVYVHLFQSLVFSPVVDEVRLYILMVATLVKLI
jgi:hypothetical protein